MTKETPRGWGLDRLCQAVQSIGSASPENDWHGTAERSATPTVRRIRIADLTGALASGLDDFKANRTGVIFLCAIYPIVGLVLGLVASGDQVWAVVFPLASGFALVGPLAAVGLSEMSRRRERGDAVRCRDAFGVLRSPSIGAIALLGLLLVGIFLLWLAAAKLIYVATLGPAAPASVAAFAYQVLGTPAGWAMIAIGVGVGFLFAVPVLAIGFVAFPLLLDRNAGIEHGGVDLGAGGGGQSRGDGRLGGNRRGLAGDRVAAGTGGAGHGAACGRACHLAPVSAGGWLRQGNVYALRRGRPDTGPRRPDSTVPTKERPAVDSRAKLKHNNRLPKGHSPAASYHASSADPPECAINSSRCLHSPPIREPRAGLAESDHAARKAALFVSACRVRTGGGQAASRSAAGSPRASPRVPGRHPGAARWRRGRPGRSGWRDPGRAWP